MKPTQEGAETVGFRFEFKLIPPHTWSAEARCSNGTVFKSKTSTPVYPSEGFQAFFKKQFIAEAQHRAVIAATEEQIILAPENYVPEYWTKAHLTRVYQALRRPRKRIVLPLLRMNHVKITLLRGWWTGPKLREMDRNELADWINAYCKCNPELKPGTIWKMAERLNLISARTSGPKPIYLRHLRQPARKV